MTPQSQKKHDHPADPMSCGEDNNDNDEQQRQQQQQQQQSSTTCTTDEDNNINRLVAQRTRYRKEQKWKEADEIKAVLENNEQHQKHPDSSCTSTTTSIELIDRCDGSSSWRKIVHDEKQGKNHYVKIVRWSKMNVTRPLASSSSPANNNTSNNNNIETDDDDDNNAADIIVPLVLVTVDAPQYRERLGETLQHLKEICNDNNETNEKSKKAKATRFCPEPVDMLDLAKHPLLNSKRILFEGWRTILLPHLLLRQEGNSNNNNSSDRVVVEEEYYSRNDDGFVLVAEDDVRFPSEWTPDRLRTECMAAFQSNPDVHVLSMGHHWATLRPNRQQRRRQKKRHGGSSKGSDGDDNQDIIFPANEPRPSLLQHLQKNGGIHASTLFAIRAPEGLRHLFDALNAVKRNKKKTHIDQFLFLSTLHNVGLALSDPPLVGWAEVSTTLTSAGPGQRRRDGGRLGQLPAQNENGKHVEWVQRKLVTMKVKHHHHDHHVNKLEHDDDDD